MMEDIKNWNLRASLKQKGNINIFSCAKLVMRTEDGKEETSGAIQTVGELDGEDTLIEVRAYYHFYIEKLD